MSLNVVSQFTRPRFSYIIAFLLYSSYYIAYKEIVYVPLILRRYEWIRKEFGGSPFSYNKLYEAYVLLQLLRTSVF